MYLAQLLILIVALLYDVYCVVSGHETISEVGRRNSLLFYFMLLLHAHITIALALHMLFD